MKKMFRLFKPAIFILTVFASAAVFASQAQAAPVVSTAFGAGFPISETNMAPGQIFTRQFTVTNNTGDAQSLMINFSKSTDSGIAQKISVKIQKPDATFSVLPNGADTELLSDIYVFNNAFVFDTLSGPVGNASTYTLIFNFDINAGNEFQSKETVFDLMVGIDAVPARITSHHHGDGGSSGGGGGTGGGIITTTVVGGPAGAVAGAVITTPEQGGQGVGNQEGQGQVAGEETQCSEWPLWVWILIMLIYLGLVSLSSFYKYKEDNDLRWVQQSVELIAVLLIWYFYDVCRLYVWFPWVAIIGGVGLYILYLNMRKKAEPQVK